MWTSLEPNSSTWEPTELRKLKEKLAHLSCKCSSCEQSKFPSTVIVLAQNDKQVQVQEPKRGSFDQFTQVSPESMVIDHNHFLNTLTKDVLCPSCFVTMNLIRGGVLRVLKDEQSETTQDMFCCDKSTERFISAMEKSTSVTNKPVPKFSNLTLCDFISECSSDLSVSMPSHGQKRSQHQVKFVDVDEEEEQERKKMVPYNDRTCVCLENFIDSIRPPLVDAFFVKQ